jgi:hypothetical protein
MPGPIVTAAIGLRARLEMRDLGYGTSDIWGAMRHYTPDVLNRAAQLAGPEAVAALTAAPPETGVGATGDHPILDWIIAFAESPLGKALISVLITILLGMLVAKT